MRLEKCTPLDYTVPLLLVRYYWNHLRKPPILCNRNC